MTAEAEDVCVYCLANSTRDYKSKLSLSCLHDSMNATEKAPVW